MVSTILAVVTGADLLDCHCRSCASDVTILKRSYLSELVLLSVTRIYAYCFIYFIYYHFNLWFGLQVYDWPVMKAKVLGDVDFLAAGLLFSCFDSYDSSDFLPIQQETIAWLFLTCSHHRENLNPSLEIASFDARCSMVISSLRLCFERSVIFNLFSSR